LPLNPRPDVPQYRTEVEIPPDRYVCLQLPSHFPSGRATVTVLLHAPEATDETPPAETDPDHQDIEWWDEFEEDRERIG
jgi:hypothetical protein